MSQKVCVKNTEQISDTVRGLALNSALCLCVAHEVLGVAYDTDGMWNVDMW